MFSFKEAFGNCHLIDLGHKVDKYTWSNKHGDTTFTKEKLDKAVTSPRWTQLYSGRRNGDSLLRP